MSTLDKNQIITHSTQSIAYTAYDISWIPVSPRFVVLGQLPRGDGVISVYQLGGGSVNLKTQVSCNHSEREA